LFISRTARARESLDPSRPSCKAEQTSRSNLLDLWRQAKGKSGVPQNPGPPHRPARPLRALVAVALLAGALPACGGGNSSDSGSTSIVATHGDTDHAATP